MTIAKQLMGTTSLYKFHCRILLGQARKEILRVWAPHCLNVKWTEVCADRLYHFKP